MADQNEQKNDSDQTANQSGPEIPFDATTNFSLLGWIWSKINKTKRSKEIVDLKLDG